jgi:hypothetical protein
MNRDLKRNANGFFVAPEPKRIPKGNLNPGSYRDGVGKTNAAPATLLNGENLYAADGQTQDWFALHPEERP